MSKKLTLTPASLDALKKGSIADPQTPGLYIEALASGKRVWKFRRRIPGVVPELKDRLGLYPATTIAAAREWARGINEKIDAGVDPRDEARAQEQRELLTVDRCHEMYMEAVRLNQHRTRRSQIAKPIKPRTISEKQAMYEHVRASDVERIVKLETNLANLEKGQERIEHQLDKMEADSAAGRAEIITSIREISKRELKP